MAHKLGCYCQGNPACKLCHGAGKYDYEPGPRGWMPFTCPTCQGKRYLSEPGQAQAPCFTCRAHGQVDPADPPSSGWADVIWKSIFGAT
jgi:hypothetical protein